MEAAQRRKPHGWKTRRDGYEQYGLLGGGERSRAAGVGRTVRRRRSLGLISCELVGRKDCVHASGRKVLIWNS